MLDLWVFFLFPVDWNFLDGSSEKVSMFDWICANFHPLGTHLKPTGASYGTSPRRSNNNCWRDGQPTAFIFVRLSGSPFSGVRFEISEWHDWTVNLSGTSPFTSLKFDLNWFKSFLKFIYSVIYLFQSLVYSLHLVEKNDKNLGDAIILISKLFDWKHFPLNMKNYKFLFSVHREHHTDPCYAIHTSHI